MNFTIYDNINFDTLNIFIDSSLKGREASLVYAVNNLNIDDKTKCYLLCTFFICDEMTEKTKQITRILKNIHGK